MVIFLLDLIKVTYHDVTEFEEFEYKQDLDELKPDTIELIGWQLKRDEKYLILAIGKSDETYEHVYVIPDGCIKNVEYLK